MKINDLLSGQQTGNKTSGQPKQAAEQNFKELLNNQIQPAAGPLDTSAVKQITHNPGVSATLRIESLALTEKTINTLESFGTALADPNLAAEDIEPFVVEIEEEVQALLGLKEEMPQKDPLAKLVDRVATIAYLESAKYRRGDYIAR